MPKVDIYTTPVCPYCLAAKDLLSRKGVAFIEIPVLEPEARARMVARAHGRRTVPQIFIGNVHVGGFEDIAALERRGEVDALLGRAADEEEEV